MGHILHLLFFLPLALSWGKWCGKHYELGAPDTPPPPESYFAHPKTSQVDLLDFRCTTSSSIYLAGDETDRPSVILDANITRDVGKPYERHRGEDLAVEIRLDGHVCAMTIIEVGSMGVEVYLALDDVQPRLEPYTIHCVASGSGVTFEDDASLFYLTATEGSAVRLDRQTGAMATWSGARWKSITPFGWYDSFDAAEKPAPPRHWISAAWATSWDWASWVVSGLPSSTLSSWLGGAQAEHAIARDSRRTNMNRLALAHQHGFNMIHPVPGGASYADSEGSTRAIEAYLDEASRLGIRVMYDMRHGFTDLAEVREQVTRFRNHPALLVWYIADEPDGPPTPLDSVARAAELIRSLDPYHPTAVVLNCRDHHWSAYTSGVDILLADVYSIALNPIWSKKWSTPVTPTFGASGCDGCIGNFYDLTSRLDEWRERARVEGRRRKLVHWVVPQAFNDHGEEFWWRVPEGVEEAVQIILAWNHGAMGHCAWLASSATPDLLNNASFVAQHLYAQSDFLIGAASTRRALGTTVPLDGSNGLDVAAWTRLLPGGIEETLVMAAQMNYIGLDQSVDFGVIGARGKVKHILFGQVRMKEDGSPLFVMGRTSVAAVVLRYRKHDEEGLDITPKLTMPVPVGMRS